MEEMTWTQRLDARNEQRLRELASDLADRVEAGEMTQEDANALYTRTADRLMHDL
jgi:hypothetical protein